MPTITLELPVAGTDIDAGPVATNFADLQALLNGGLDGANFVDASLTLGSSFALNIGGDTNLYRSAANVLKTDDQFQSASRIDAVDNIRARLGGAAEMQMGDSGPGNTAGIIFGTAQDTNLYRSAANTLKTDDEFHVGANLKLNPGGQITLTERTDPSNVADAAVLYARDNGSGKTQLVVRLDGGAAIVLATAP